MIDRDGYLAWKGRTLGTEFEIWHDGLAVENVTRLRGDERDEALAMLRFGVAGGDSHASTALAEMGDVSSRGEILAQLGMARGAARVRVALAAHRLLPDESLADPLVEVLHHAPSWSDRIDAAIGLRHFVGPSSELALLEAIEQDVEYLIRYHACESLLARWGTQPCEIAKHEAIFRLVAEPREGPPTPEQAAGHHEARAKMESLRGR